MHEPPTGIGVINVVGVVVVVMTLTFTLSEGGGSLQVSVRVTVVPTSLSDQVYVGPLASVIFPFPSLTSQV